MTQRVAVLKGGRSLERSVSLSSAARVEDALERLGQDGRPGAVVRLAERWRPYRASAVQHLWASLAEPTTTELAA